MINGDLTAVAYKRKQGDNDIILDQCLLYCNLFKIFFKLNIA